MMMAGELYLLWEKYWWAALLVICLSGLYIGFAFLERRSCEKKIESITNVIRSMADGKAGAAFSETEETLPSKTYHQLERLQKIMQESGRKICQERDSIQRLISEIAHQMRNPLINIKMYTELLNQPDVEREEMEKYLYAVSHSEEKLSFLVESFIKMSRLEHQLIQINWNSRNLKETVLNAVFQLRSQAESKKITIEVRQSGLIEINHDANWLGEAIYNILDNSVKYSPQNSKIIITIQQNEMFTEIAIRDYGIGIEREEEAQIFQRFYRGKRVTKEEGFGIGLYLSREIILKHGGFIKVKRESPGLQVAVFLSSSV